MLEAQDPSKIELQGKEIKEVPKPQSREELQKQVDDVGEYLRKLIVLAKLLPRKGLEPHQDELRCLGQAQTLLQTGLMWLRRAIDAPKVF